MIFNEVMSNQSKKKCFFYLILDNSVTKNLRNIFKKRFCKENFKLLLRWKAENFRKFFLGK